MHTGIWEQEAIAWRLAKILPSGGPDPAWLARRICIRFGEETAPDIRELSLFLRHEKLLQAVYQSEAIRGPLLDPHVMAPRPDNLVTFPLPELPTRQDVGLWLCLYDTEITWFADSKYQQNTARQEKLHHYRYAWVPKRSGGLRLIEKPKSRLKEIQRTIVKDILNRVPPHPCAHGFTRGRSIKTFAAPHTGQQAVLRLDLKDFFHSVPVARITALFQRLGYPPHVARLLQGFCTNAVAPALAGEAFAELSWQDRNRLQNKHLPQGAPSSAPLANLSAWKLDCRLDGLAKRYGYTYTRYADDMAISGPASLARRAGFIEALAGAIAIEEGFHLNHRKTRLCMASQQQKLAGIVVNEKANISRADWDSLKAILHNCVKHGPESQNRDNHPNFRAHLEGRVAHIEWINPLRAKKLRALLDRIGWKA